MDNDDVLRCHNIFLDQLEQFSLIKVLRAILSHCNESSPYYRLFIVQPPDPGAEPSSRCRARRTPRRKIDAAADAASTATDITADVVDTDESIFPDDTLEPLLSAAPPPLPMTDSSSSSVEVINDDNKNGRPLLRFAPDTKKVRRRPVRRRRSDDERSSMLSALFFLLFSVASLAATLMFSGCPPSSSSSLSLPGSSNNNKTNTRNFSSSSHTPCNSNQFLHNIFQSFLFSSSSSLFAAAEPLQELRYNSFDVASNRVRRHFAQNQLIQSAYAENSASASSSSSSSSVQRRSPLETTASGGSGGAAPLLSTSKLEAWSDAIVNFTRKSDCTVSTSQGREILPIANRDNCLEFLSRSSTNMFNIYAAVSPDSASSSSSSNEQQQPTYLNRGISTRAVFAVDGGGASGRRLSSSSVGGGRRLMTVFAERNSASRSALTHDVVVVIDPFPQASWGHALLLFYIDFGVAENECIHLLNGRYLGQGECLQMARKPRCHRTESQREKQIVRLCEFNILPLVYDKADDARQQLLQCRNLPGFKPCATTPFADDRGKGLNEVAISGDYPSENNINQMRAFMSPSLSSSFASSLSPVHKVPLARCSVYQICDHAVIISGGWNALTVASNNDYAFNNAREMNSLLHRNGYRQENVRTFYANGRQNVFIPSSNASTFYSSALKMQMREYIYGLCHDPRHNQICIDTFTLYLNAPATIDAKLLLWDANNNGRIDASEQYSAAELAHDLSYCAANQIYVIIDQSYANKWLREFHERARSAPSSLENVQILMSTAEHTTYSWDNTFSQQLLMYQNYNRDSMMKVFEHLTKSSEQQTISREPTVSYFDFSYGKIHHTIYGAPAAAPQSSESGGSSSANIVDADSYKGCNNVAPSDYYVKVNNFQSKRVENNARLSRPVQQQYDENAFSRSPSSSYSNTNDDGASVVAAAADYNDYDDEENE